MSTAIAKTNPKQVAQKIMTALSTGLSEAAAIYAEYLEAGGSAEEIRKGSVIPPNVWHALEDIAAGRVDTRLFFMPAPVQSALKQLPATAQAEAIEHGVELLTKDNSSIKVKLSELTNEQAKQVFAPGGKLRSVSQQAAMLKAETQERMVAEARKSAPPASYEISHGRLIVLAPHSFTAAELSFILCKLVEGK